MEDISQERSAKYLLYSLKGNNTILIAQRRDTYSDEVNGQLTAEFVDENRFLFRKAVSANTRTGEIFLGNVDNQGQIPIVRGTGPKYLKNSNTLLFSSDLSGDTGTYFIFRKELGKKENTQLTFLPKDVVRKDGPEYLYEGDWGPDLSRDGRYLVYASSWYHQGGGGDDLFVKNLKTGSTRKLASLVESHGVFSNRGARISYVDAGGNLVVADVSGKTLLKYKIGRDLHPVAWRPDDEKSDFKQPENYRRAIIGERLNQGFGYDQESRSKD